MLFFTVVYVFVAGGVVDLPDVDLASKNRRQDDFAGLQDYRGSGRVQVVV